MEVLKEEKSIAEVKACSQLSDSQRSESPNKPDSEATEPNEDAKCVPSPSSSAYDADQSDTGSERRVEESSSSASLTSNSVVTQQMIQEENHLKKLSELEEQKTREERDQEWARLEEEDKAQRFERLQHLLKRSNMYTEYLIQRMQRQKADEIKRQERRAKKLARQQEKEQEEEQKRSSQEMQSSPANDKKQPETVHNLRHKRKVEEKDTLKGPAAKRSRTTRSGKMEERNKATEKSEEKSKAVKEEPGPATEEEHCVCTAKNGAESGLSNGKEQATAIKGEDGMDETDGGTLPVPLEPMAVFLPDEPRYFEGELIPDHQPLLMTGGILRPYQIEGFMWLRTLYENGVNGILADEMGLGKTVQCVAMLSHMVYMGVPGPFLVCAPLSTIPNWYNEFQRFAPTVPVLLYHGHKDERKVLREKIGRSHTVRSGVSVHTVVITSYEVAMMDQRHMHRYEWRYMVVDEGHRIKNTHCRLISALRMYRTTNRLLLTGTPLQNNLAELWSLLNFLLPEIFDDLGSFEEWFDIEHIDDEMVADKQKQDVLSMLHQILTPFMLRRLKTDVDLRIPPKKEVIVYAPLLPLQKEFYAALIDRTIFAKIQEKNGTVEKAAVGSNGRPLRKATQNKIDYSLMIGSDKDEKELRSSRHKAQEEEEIEGWVQAIVDMQQKRQKRAAPEQRTSQLTIKLRNVMMQLRKCCSHPFLLEHPLDPETGELSLDQRTVEQSGKMLVLDRMLKELHSRGHKVLIFSQMTKMLDLLEDFCVLRHYNYCRLDGAMNINDRRDNMAEYQKADSDKFLFLLSTRAGGLGINLTAADTVIIYDSDWNPQCDLQAQDRCHRIGQTKPVMVYRFVTANTIDQRIVERAAAKRKLEKLVIHQGKFKSGIKNFQTSLQPISSEELFELLQSKDHESEVEGGGEQAVISDEALNALLDRSDLVQRWQAKQCGTLPVSSPSDDDEAVEAALKLCRSPPLPSAHPPQGTKSTGRQRKSAASKKPAQPTPTLFKVIDIDDGESLDASSLQS